MAYNTVAIKKDVDGKPIPQFYNPITNQYEALEGLQGASKTILYDENGNPIDLTALISSVVNIINEKNLPTNASTESKQNDIIGKLTSLLEKYPVALEDGKLSVKVSDLENILKGILDVNIVESLPAGTNNIGKVDVENSNLPVGASTEAKQDELISTIDSNSQEIYANTRDILEGLQGASKTDRKSVV